MRRCLLPLPLALALSGVPAAQQAPPGAPRDPDGASRAEVVDAAVRRGVHWLLTSQQLDGSWDYHGEQPRTGATALITYTLIKSGLDRRHEAVQRAIVHLEAEPDPAQTYDTALLILALAAHDPARHRERLEGLVATLLDWQEGGDWGYPGGDGDLSNTQYAALGLWAASHAGVDVPRRSWDRLVTAALQYRTSSGGFAYTKGGGQATGSMTSAGVAVLAICAEGLGEARPGGKSNRLESALQGGIDWLGRRFSVHENPGIGAAHLAYYLYGLERAGALARTALFGGHDWYEEGSAFLAETQDPAGHWAGTLGGGLPQTCFALLFLRRATRPPRTMEQRELAGERRVQEEGAVRVTVSGENPLAMWLAGFDPELLDALEWSGEAGRGPHVTRVVWYVDGVAAASLEGDPGAPAGHERFPHRVELGEPGRHQVVAEVHVLRPPERDRTGRLLPASLKVLRSEPLAFDVELACPEWLLENARDRRRNLMPAARPAVEASSSHGGNDPWRAVDGHQGRAWLADPADERPTLEIELGQPTRADVIVLGHARTVPLAPGRWARALEVEVTINGEERHRVRMHSDLRRKARLVLPEPIAISTLELAIPWRVPGDHDERAVGLAEVELQRRGDGDGPGGPR